MSIIAYYRTSCAKQSMETQKHCIRKSYEVEKEFFDQGISGFVKVSDRAGFAAMMNYIREGDVLVISDIERISRSSIEAQEVIAHLKAMGVKIVVQSLGIDLSTDGGELLVTVLSKVAELEHRKMVQRTSLGRKLSVKKKLITQTEKSESIKTEKPRNNLTSGSGGQDKSESSEPRIGKVSVEQVAGLQAKGLDLEEIAQELGCSVWTVNRRLKKGNPKKTKNHSVSVEQVVVLHKKGLNIGAIAHELDCSEFTVRRRLKKGNPKKTKNHGVSVEQVVDLQKKGLNIDAIAHELDCSEFTVRRRLKSADLESSEIAN